MEENIKKCIHNHQKVNSLHDNINVNKLKNRDKNKTSHL